jgi:hypothetical protein
MKGILASNDGCGHMTVVITKDEEIKVQPGRTFISGLQIGDILEIDAEPGYIPTVVSRIEAKPQGTRFCVSCRIYYPANEIKEREFSQKWGMAYFSECRFGHSLGSRIEVGEFEAARLNRQIRRPMAEFLAERELENDPWPSGSMSLPDAAEIAAKEQKEADKLALSNRLAETDFSNLMDAEEAAEDGDPNAIRFFEYFDK